MPVKWHSNFLDTKTTFLGGRSSALPRFTSHSFTFRCHGCGRGCQGCAPHSSLRQRNSPRRSPGACIPMFQCRPTLVGQLQSSNASTASTVGITTTYPFRWGHIRWSFPKRRVCNSTLWGTFPLGARTARKAGTPGHTAGVEESGKEGRIGAFRALLRPRGKSCVGGQQQAVPSWQLQR